MTFLRIIYLTYVLRSFPSPSVWLHSDFQPIRFSQFLHKTIISLLSNFEMWYFLRCCQLSFLFPIDVTYFPLIQLQNYLSNESLANSSDICLQITSVNMFSHGLPSPNNTTSVDPLNYWQSLQNNEVKMESDRLISIIWDFLQCCFLILSNHHGKKTALILYIVLYMDPCK